MSKIGIALVDDDTLLIDLLGNFLSKNSHFEVFAKLPSAEDLLSYIEEDGIVPDVLVLDLKLDGMDGIELARHLSEKHPSINIIALSSYYTPDSFGFLIKSGVAAFLPKEVEPEALVKAIEQVHESGSFILKEQVSLLRSQISANIQSPKLNPANALSDREVEVLKLLAEQKTAREIADLLFVTQRTIEGHKNNLFAKTGTKNLAGLILFGVKNGYINPDNQPLI